jgi:hypothetical protein
LIGGCDEVLEILAISYFTLAGNAVRVRSK